MQSSVPGISVQKMPFNIQGIQKNAANFRKLMLIFPFIHPATLHSVIVQNKFNWEGILEVLFQKHKTASNNYWQNVEEQRRREVASQESSVQCMWNKTYEMEIQEQMKRKVNIRIEPNEQEFPQLSKWTLQDGNRWVIAQNRSQNWLNQEQTGQEYVEQSVQNYQIDHTVAQNSEYDWIDVCNDDVHEQPQFPLPDKQDITVGNQWTTAAQNEGLNWMNNTQTDQVFIQKHVHVRPICLNKDVPVAQQTVGINMQNDVNNKIQSNKKRKYIGKSIEEMEKDIADMHRRIEMEIIKMKLLPKKQQILNQNITTSIARKPTNARNIIKEEKDKVDTKLNEEKAQDVPLNLISRKGKANGKTRLKASKKKTGVN